MTNQDTSAQPARRSVVERHRPGRGADAHDGVREASLARFGEQAIKRGQPMALIEEVLVPLYLHHRYQVEAAASAVGGIHYIYAMRGDGREPVKAGAGARAARRARRADGDAQAVGAGAAVERSSAASRRGRPATACTASCSRATPG